MRAGASWALGDWLVEMGTRYGSTYEAAAVVGLDLQTLKNLKTLAAAFERSRRRDDLSLSHHDAVLGLEPDMQDRFLAQAATEKLTRQQLRTLVRDLRRQEQRWPEGKYALILADPPWKYATGPGGYLPENHYPTLTSEEIAALPVVDLAADDCLLYLWVTNKHLREALLTVLPAWGFAYVTNHVWVKGGLGMGVWTRARHELLLIATKGSPTPADGPDRADSVIEAPRREHSRKPDEVYDLIERQYPGVPKVELFARRSRPGWARWGNERLDQEDAA
jgi:N6-adenosine-specific RNA methylase IME4